MQASWSNNPKTAAGVPGSQLDPSAPGSPEREYPGLTPYAFGQRMAARGRPILTAIGYQLRFGVGTGSGDGLRDYHSYVRGYHSVRPTRFTLRDLGQS
jgi:hypothetical protein